MMSSLKPKRITFKNTRDEMKANNTDHISNYSLDYVSHTEVK